MHWSIPCFFILACHVYLLLCIILLCLRFELHFLIHLAPFMHHYHCSYLHLLPSFLLDTFVVLIASCLYVGHAYILMLLCFIECMFGWSFSLLCDYCNHFNMTVLVYDQVAHMFHIIFTWSQFICYIIRVLLLLVLPWRSNVFCASVSGYKYICSKFIITPMIHDRGSDMIGAERDKELCVILNMFLLYS